MDLAFRGSKSTSDLFVSLDLFPHKGAAKGRASDLREKCLSGTKQAVESTWVRLVCRVMDLS